MADLTRRDLIKGAIAAGAVSSAIISATSMQSFAATFAESGPAFAKNAIIRTILKDVSPQAPGKGATLIHEHLSMSSASSPVTEPLTVPPGLVPPLVTLRGAPHFSDDIDLMVREVDAAGDDGVSCIVDAGARALGGSVDHLRQIANRTKVHIVVGGGGHFNSYPADVRAKMTADQLAEDFIRDAKTDRWGALGEIASSAALPPQEIKVMQAISKVHLRTGLAIFTHTPHDGCPKCAMDQIDLYESQGVDLKRLVIGHMSDINDPKAELHKVIAKRGAFVGLDTVGHQGLRPTPPDSVKVAMALALIDAGYEDHILLSSDFWEKSELKANFGSGISVAVIQFAPKLRSAGVKAATIHKILVDNPRRLLAFVPKES